MNLPVPKNIRFNVITALAFVAMTVPGVMGQETPVVQQPSAPPPVKIITREDRARVDGSKDDKARIRITIELAEGYLTEAEARTTQEDYDAASAALGKYRALIEDALNFLRPFARDHNRTRDLYKRLELALRAQGPRLTAIRRTTPLEYAVWVKEQEEFARQGRTDALNSFYGETVVKDPQSRVGNDNRSKKKDGTPSRDNKPQ